MIIIKLHYRDTETCRVAKRTEILLHQNTLTPSEDKYYARITCL